MPSNNSIPKLMDFVPSRGYVSSSAKEEGGNHLAPGSENIYFTGAGKSQVFKDVTERGGQSGSSVLANVIENFAGLGQASDPTAFGSVFNVFSALFYIGAGLLRLNGASLLVSASSTLSLLIKRNSSYTDPLSGAFQAGLAQPSAPTIRAISPPSGFTGKINGVVSVVIWRIRGTTGARSVRSEVSNVVTATNQAIAVTFPLADANGQDYWGIGVTIQGEGATGSHFELLEISEADVSGTPATYPNAASGTISDNTLTVTGANFTSANIGYAVEIPSIVFTTYIAAVNSPTSVELADPLTGNLASATAIVSKAVDGQERTIPIEWRDGELSGQPLAPFRDYPPPAGSHAGALESIAFVDGTYADAVDAVSADVRGSAIAPSEPGYPESYSPDTVIFTNDTPVALLRGDGIYWRICKNSAYVIRYLGGERPLSVEPAWQGIGVPYQNNAVLGDGGRPYIWAENDGALRLGSDGTLDGAFANDVADDLTACTDASKRVLGVDGIRGVCYCYEKTVWVYFTRLGIWSAPLRLDIEGNIKACVTVNNQLIISDDLDNLYDFNTGTGTTAKIMTGWQVSRQMLDTVHSVVCSVRADNTTNPITIEVYADGNPSVAESSFSLTPARTGYQRLLPVKPNLIDAESHAVKITITSTGGDCGVESIQSFGDSNSILR